MNKVSEHKLNKLANAIRAYRGLTQPVLSGEVEWAIPPQKSRLPDVVRWLIACRRKEDDIPGDLTAIDGFKNIRAFRAWLDETFRKEEL